MRPHTLRSKGRLLLLDKPLVMGILNATPDSFFEGSRIHSENEVAEVAGKMLENGAAILDLGGQSTRPEAVRIGPEEEMDRVISLVEIVKNNHPECWISIDTFYASVAEKAILAGADIVNDISAGDDDKAMLQTVSRLAVPYIAMHKKGNPESMQNDPKYDNVMMEIISYFRNKKSELESMEIYDWILDPGFGFGKTLGHNYRILNELEAFQIFDRPVMVGISRKGMIQKALNVSADKALNGTTALHMIALLRKAAILRVHDVREAVECVNLYQMLDSAN